MLDIGLVFGSKHSVNKIEDEGCVIHLGTAPLDDRIVSEMGFGLPWMERRVSKGFQYVEEGETCDKMCAYRDDPSTKHECTIWKHAGSTVLKKVWQSNSIGKVMVLDFLGLLWCGLPAYASSRYHNI